MVEIALRNKSDTTWPLSTAMFDIGNDRKRYIMPFCKSLHTDVAVVVDPNATVCTIIQSGYFTDDKLHTIRKILKDFFYNLECCNQKQKKKIFHLLNIVKEEAYFNNLTALLGAYQDICSRPKPFT